MKENRIKRFNENSELDTMDKNNPDLHSEIMQVVMWLYEKHGIWISSTHVRNRFRYEIIKKYGTIDYSSFDFKSPTEAYEEAIEYCLTKLISK